MIKAKANIVSFWQSETQAMQDFISGKVWVTYAWPDTYAQVVAKPAMKNAKVVYMQPKEGQLAWICAFAIAAKPKNEDLAYAYLNTAYSAPAMDFLVNAFFTGGSAMTPATLAKTDPKFVKQFHLNSLYDGAQAAEGVARAAPREPQRLPQGLPRRSSRPDRRRRGGRPSRPPRRVSPWQRDASARHRHAPRRVAGAVARRSRRTCCSVPGWRCCWRSSSRRSTTSSCSRPASATRA